MKTIDIRPIAIRQISVSAMDNNCYLLTCNATSEQLLIDAADDFTALQNMINAGTSQLSKVLTTHQHWDHHRALPQIVTHYQPASYAGAADAAGLPVPPDVRLNHGDQILLGDTSLEILALRGHTPGSIAVAYQDDTGRTHLFTGDSLFPGGPGKTNTPQDFAQLMDDLQTRVFDQYPDDTMVYPGHGKPTTLSVERPQIPQWLARGW